MATNHNDLQLSMTTNHNDDGHGAAAADVSAQINDRSNALHLASWDGHIDLRWVLIEHGADMSARKKDRSLVLHLASLNGHVNLGQMLIEHGTNVPHQQLTMLTTNDADYRPQWPRRSGGSSDDTSDNNNNH